MKTLARHHFIDDRPTRTDERSYSGRFLV